MLWIQSHMIFPESLTDRYKTILLRNDNFRNSLPRIIFLVPRRTSILNRLLLEVFAKLNLERIFCFMIAVEFF